MFCKMFGCRRPSSPTSWSKPANKATRFDILAKPMKPDQLIHAICGGHPT
jgi:hypothetical protein